MCNKLDIELKINEQQTFICSLKDLNEYDGPMIQTSYKIIFHIILGMATQATRYFNGWK
jgi:hypothetical protein